MCFAHGIYAILKRIPSSNLLLYLQPQKVSKKGRSRAMLFIQRASIREQVKCIGFAERKFLMTMPLFEMNILIILGANYLK
jgi:hypothetical protein